jgi:hypothetical protein
MGRFCRPNPGPTWSWTSCPAARRRALRRLCIPSPDLEKFLPHRQHSTCASTDPFSICLHINSFTRRMSRNFAVTMRDLPLSLFAAFFCRCYDSQCYSCIVSPVPQSSQCVKPLPC